MPVTPVDQANLGPLLSRQFVYGFNLAALALDRFGTECLGWDGCTIDREFADEFGGDLEVGNFHRLMAALSVLAHDGFYKSAADFLVIVRTLSGELPAAGQDGLPDLEDVAWGMTEAMLVRPPEPDDHAPFAPEVCALVGELLDAEGVLFPPDVLKIGLVGREGHTGDFAMDSDPGLFQTVSQFQEARSAELRDTVRRRLIDLLKQFEGLPVRKKMKSVRSLQERLARLGPVS
jgi:hypothetical protein